MEIMSLISPVFFLLYFVLLFLSLLFFLVSLVRIVLLDILTPHKFLSLLGVTPEC